VLRDHALCRHRQMDSGGHKEQVLDLNWLRVL
jgi:hypothetical protein